MSYPIPDLSSDDLISGAPGLAWRIHRSCICPWSQHHRNMFKNFASPQSIKEMWDSVGFFAMNQSDQFRLPIIGCISFLLWCSTEHIQNSYPSSYSSWTTSKLFVVLQFVTNTRAHICTHTNMQLYWISAYIESFTHDVNLGFVYFQTSSRAVWSIVVTSDSNHSKPMDPLQI